MDTIRTWSNPKTTERLIDLIDHINATRYDRPNVSLIGMEIEGLHHHAGEQWTLAPMYDPIGFAPHIGQIIESSALGCGPHWRVTAVAQGYPGEVRILRGAPR